jgi:hypothetical protein
MDETNSGAPSGAPATKGRVAKSLIPAIVVREGVPYVEQIGTDLKTMQKIVGGYVEHVTLRGPFAGLHMWVNEQGHLEALPVWSQPLYPGPIAGDFFVTRLTVDGDATGLTVADIEKIRRAFR